MKKRQKTGISPRAKPYMEAQLSPQAKLSSEVEEWLLCERRSLEHLNRATSQTGICVAIGRRKSKERRL